MIINRVWAMPNKNTFSIKPIKELLERHVSGFSVDPFSNTNRIATVTNDLNPECGAQHCMDALEFLKTIPDGSVDTVLYDPPYSARQVSEIYKKMDMVVDMETTQASYWANQKKEIGRITKTGGKVITCSWNSGGIGMKYGFEIEEVLLVPHGGWHHDTIIVVDRKIEKPVELTEDQLW